MQKDHLRTKDMQSVHCFIVGSDSWVPTWMLERAVVFVAAVVPALGNGALDAMVGMAITAHERFLLCLISSLVCAAPPGKIMEIPSIFKLTAPENSL